MITVVIARGDFTEEVRFFGLGKGPTYIKRRVGRLVAHEVRDAKPHEIRMANAALLAGFGVHPVEACECHGTGVLVVDGQPEPCPCVETWEAA